MPPTFQRHLGRYALSMWLGMTFLCLMLSFALLRNSQSLSLLELLIAGVSIAVGVTYGTMRDAPGYWIYSTLVAKFIMSKEEIGEIRGLGFSPLIRWLNPLQTPFGMPLLAGVGIFLLLWTGYQLFPAHPKMLAFSIIGVLLPMLLSLMLLKTARLYIVLASPDGEDLISKSMHAPRKVNAYLREDMLIALLINFALIWPLQSKSAFSLDGGYDSRGFIIASVLLTWIAAFFTLLSSRRSRLFSAVGEQLSRLFSHETVSDEPRPARSMLPRALLYYALLGIWTLGLCLLFGILPIKLPFTVFCGLLLPALGAMFWHERRLTLWHDVQQAAQFIDEQTIQPVASARRMPELS
jgi:hypothetical protein